MFFDFTWLSGEDSKVLSATTTSARTCLISMKHSLYFDYHSCNLRIQLNVLNVLKLILPYIQDISKSLRTNMLKRPKEFELWKDRVLEQEGEMAGNIYLIIRGKVDVHKRIKGFTHDN
jgi:hypothetical protein